MDKLSRFEIRVSNGKIVSGNPVNGTYMLIEEESVGEVDEKLFVKIEPFKLSIDDKFMQHSPRTFKERCFKDLLAAAIKHKVEIFYCPRYAPSLTEDGSSFCYEPGRMPAVGKPYAWWEAEARRFKPDRESRIGTKYEYALFLATLMKKMVDAGNSVELVWKFVCSDSAVLATYSNSPESTKQLLPVGAECEVFGFYDLGNTYKLLIENESADSFWLASGSFSDESTKCPIANIERTHDHSCFEYHSIGWVVFH